MLYSKVMIDIIKEARKRVPDEDKPLIKMANPRLLVELHRIYRRTQDNMLRGLVEDLFSMAGDPWASLVPRNVQVSEVPITKKDLSREGLKENTREFKGLKEVPILGKLIAGNNSIRKRVHRVQSLAE